MFHPSGKIVRQPCIWVYKIFSEGVAVADHREQVPNTYDRSLPSQLQNAKRQVVGVQVSPGLASQVRNA